MPIDNKELGRRFIEEVWNKKNVAVADELIAANYIHHDPQNSPCNGAEQYKQIVRQYLDAFPDAHIEIEDQISEGQTVVTRWTATGTHAGSLSGIPPTGKRFAVSGISIGRLKDGKFVEGWANWDTLGMMQQLGVVPSEMRAKAA
jgi:steroid delta-isomerase-like uncharacterized protein